MSFVFNGKTYDIPGSYGILEVIQNAGANIPDFQVGLIAGRSMKGIPFDSTKPGSSLIPAYDNGNDLLRDYGDDNIYQAYKYMSKHGGGMVFVLNVLDSDTNKKCNTTLQDGETTPGDSMKLTASDMWAGTCANDIEIGIVKTDLSPDPDLFTMTLTPPRNVKRLVQDAVASSQYIYTNSIDGLSIGSKVLLNSNGLSDSIERTILNIDPIWNSENEGYKITFEEAFTTVTEITVAKFARIFQQDEKSIEVITWHSDETIITVVNRINSLSKLIVAEESSLTAKLPDEYSADYFQNLGPSPVKGETVTANTNEALRTFYSNVCTAFPDIVKDFINVNKVKIRLVYFDSNDSTVHGYFRDLAVAMRTNRSPICVIAGAGLGEDADALVTRAKAVNSDDFVLCGGGADNLPANLSFAPSVLGIKMNNGVNHNLTRDMLSFNSVEMDWTDSNLTKLLKNGVFVYDKFPSGFRVVRGINTYQDQTHVWNAQDRKTYLQMPRDLADAFFRGLLEGLDNDLVGSDQVTRKKVETYCVKTGNNFKASGLINDFKVLAIKRGEAGWLPEVQIEVDDPTDFFGTRIFVISPTLE